MAIEHLTDSILQDYLDGSLGDKESEIITHLDSCSLCQARLRHYELLYTELEVDTVPALSPDFSNVVMSQIAQIDIEASAIEDKKQPVAVQPMAVSSLVYAIIGAIVAIATTIYFVNLEPMIRAFQITAFSNYFNRVIVSKVSSATADLGSVGDRFNFSLILMVIATLIVIGGIDYIVRHYKHRTASFMV